MKISYYELCRSILEGENLTEKLQDLSAIQFDEWKPYEIPTQPGRASKIVMSEKRAKFPKNFETEATRAKAIHFFANHELLAIEMMAAALLHFPHSTEEEIKLKRGIVQTLKEEQKHFKLYQARMKEFGMEFGDLPLNAFFWRQMHSIHSLDEYLAMMALTFEMANLDFMMIYKEAFLEVEDQKSAQILDIVLQDEISHVALGATVLNKNKGSHSLWDYYLSLLPFPLTPVRSKGQRLNMEARLKAGLDQEFLEKAISYDDQYAVTQRREWKK